MGGGRRAIPEIQPGKENVMVIRDLIPWSRQDNRLPLAVSAERGQATHPLFALHREVDRLFENAFRSFALPAFGSGALDWPHIELSETDKEIRVTAELPGLDEKDVDVSIEDGALTLRGEKKAEVEDKDRGYTERSYGRFERRIALPRGVDHDQASATFRNGVLTISLPRSEAVDENVRRIPINGGVT